MQKGYDFLAKTFRCRFLKTALFFAAIALTGCFEVREEVNMKADGSGEAVFQLDLSQSKENVKQYLTMETVEGYKVPKKATVEQWLADAKATMGAVPGITQVIVKSDWSNYVFRVSCSFAKIESLNNAMKALAKKVEKMPAELAAQPNFSYNNSQFQRLFSNPGRQKEFLALPSMQRYVLESAKMTSIYRFDRSIRQVSNKKAQLSPSGKSVMLQLPLAEVIKGAASLANTVVF